MTDRNSVFITGNSSGIGLGLTVEYLSRGYDVYGISRRGCPLQDSRLHDVQCDLAELDSVGPALQTLLGDIRTLDLAVLNAGVLGAIRELHDTPMADVRRVMDINLWANKAVMDWLHDSGMRIRQVVFMSSGASVNGNKGWSGYALSKAALNMMAQLYVHEFPDTHISSFAPGLVHTPMQDDIRDHVDSRRFPSTQVLKDAIGTESMPEPREAGRLLADAFEELPAYPVGSLIDIRNMQKKRPYT
jgi:NAD(P)-dependent dehydrogenase (short-subunit alcohol dehydrogenase family)